MSPSPTPTVFARACRGQEVPYTPVWIMRQAGRYLPEYRALREEVDFLTATRTPEIAARITLQPLERFPLDAAILFSDIMTPLEGMGVDVEFTPGPSIVDPVRSRSRAEGLRELDPAEGVPFVMDAIRIVRGELRPEAAVIGFSGAPFTLFCYLVEGGGSKSFMEARRFLREEAEVSTELLALLGTSMGRYLAAQAEAGADALMLFDSWIGLLGPDDFRRLALPALQQAVAIVRSATDKPLIYFAHGGATLLDDARGLGADVLGIDWTLPLSAAARILGPEAVVQGNLDPSLLYAPRDVLGRAIDHVLAEGRHAAGHVFNLGHGIDRGTDPDQVAFLVDRVHESSRGRAGKRPRAEAATS